MLIVIVIVIVLGLVASAYVVANGRSILLVEIEKNLGVKAQIGRVGVAFPASVVVDNLALGETIKIERVVISPSFLGLFNGHIILNSLVLEKARFKVTRRSDRTIDLGLGARKKKEEVAGIPAAVVPQEKKTVVKRHRKFFLNKLLVRDADITLVDEGVVAPQPFQMRLTHFNANVFHPNLWELSRLQFRGQGSLVTMDEKLVGSIDSSGWVDVLAKDMDAKIALPCVHLAYLEPYYKKFLKKELTSGDMVLTAALFSKNNDLIVDCHLELKDIAFKQLEAPVPAEGEAQPSDLTVLAFNSILNSQGSMVFDFSIRTKMDRPRLGKIKMKGVFLQSGQDTQDLKKMGDKFKEIGKEFKKAFKNKKNSSE